MRAVAPEQGSGRSDRRSSAHSALRCGPDEFRVLRQYTLGVARRQWLPALPSRRHFCLVHQHLEQAVGDIEPDPVAVTHERDGAAVDGLGRNMPDAQAGGAAGESPVGEQQDILAETCALDAPVIASISRIPGPPFGPSYRMTTTSPAVMVPSSSASIAARSRSNTRAVPSNTDSSKPADFTTAPPGAREPRRIVIPPVG